MGERGNSLCRDVPAGCQVMVLVSAGSSRSGVQAVHGTALKVAVRSAPEKGKANAEVEKVLASFLRVSRKQARVVAGHTSRLKRVQFTGIGSARVRALLREADLA